jgi:hypothetical protein
MLLEHILSGNYSKAKEVFEELANNIFEGKLEEITQKIKASEYEKIDEVNVLKLGRTRLVKVRVRGGKVQRRKKFATQPGYTIRNGRVVRMSSLEVRHRRLGAKRAKIKRRPNLNRSLRKRLISIRKRKALGL